MKRILLALLGIFVVLGLSGVVGWTGYRFGYAQGVQVTVNSDSIRPGNRSFDNIDPRGRPDFGMGRGSPRDFGWGRFPIIGFGFFSPLRWFMPSAVVALIALFIYWLFTRSGWHFTRQRNESLSPKPENE